MRLFDRKNEEWRLDAMCRGMDVNLFFPEQGVDVSDVDLRSITYEDTGF